MTNSRLPLLLENPLPAREVVSLKGFARPLEPVVCYTNCPGGHNPPNNPDLHVAGNGMDGYFWAHTSYQSVYTRNVLSHTVRYNAPVDRQGWTATITNAQETQILAGLITTAITAYGRYQLLSSVFVYEQGYFGVTGGILNGYGIEGNSFVNADGSSGINMFLTDPNNNTTFQGMIYLPPGTFPAPNPVARCISDALKAVIGGLGVIVIASAAALAVCAATEGLACSALGGIIQTMGFKAADYIVESAIADCTGGL